MKSLFVGADEVGRGAFAGPVIAGAVILPPDIEAAWNDDPKRLPVVIRDSKKMTALQRSKSAAWIRENAVAYAMGEGSVELINTAGIMQALQFAFNSAIHDTAKNHYRSVQKLLIDAFTVRESDYFSLEEQEAIIHGDALSCHIAAASIVAKVYRDKLMENLSQEENNVIYKWYANKGYGTKAHKEAISQYGICRHHRVQFVKTAFKNKL